MDINQKKEKKKVDYLDFAADQYLGIACQNSPVVQKTIESYGDISLADFLTKLNSDAGASFQSRDDLIDIIYRYTAPLLGNSVALKAAKNFEASPVVLTANHQGVDYFAQSVQGSLLFALSKKNGNGSASTVPVFSTGSVPLNNLTYPRGLLLYDAAGIELKAFPKKLPVFSDSQKRTMVSSSAPLSKEMVNRAKTRVDKMAGDNTITSERAESLQTLFDEDYSSPEVMDLSSYSQQSVILNHRIWNKLFADSVQIPKMVNLEIEEITRKLLVSDLSNPASLAWCVMFDPLLREEVIKALDDAKACWSLESLKKSVYKKQIESGSTESFNGGGTIFFWGINAAGRRIPLYLETKGQTNSVFIGIDDSGAFSEMPFSPESIIEGLNTRRLLPSLFTCFLVLSFARGVTCAGGYYQANYLPVMQAGLIHALNTSRTYHDVANHVGAVTTNTYLSGMQVVMTRLKEDALIPAGPIEIIAGGGLIEDDIQKILKLTVREAHLASLFETLPDVARWEITDENWQKILAEDCAKMIGEKVVIK